MPGPPRSLASSERGPVAPRLSPAGLWAAVLSARADFAQERNQRAHDQMSARVELLDALEAYVESLTDRGLPVPYPLRDELRLMRSTCPARGHARQSPHA